ncbi:MAG: MBL fold metallo-hydrolase [Candidatus Thorarchaeota archaeon]
MKNEDLLKLSDLVVVDTQTQYRTHACILGAFSLESYLVTIDTGDLLSVGVNFRREIEDYFNLSVKYIFLTHTNSDHRGGLEAFKDCTVILSSKCIENTTKSLGLNKYTKVPFDVEYSLHEKNRSVIFTRISGHTIGFSTAFYKEEKILFAGDLFITGKINFGLPFLGFYQNKPRRTGNPEEYLAAFEKFRKMDIEIIIPGHGDIISNPKEYLKEETNFFATLKEHIKSEIERCRTIEQCTLPDLERIHEAYKEAAKSSPPSRGKRFLDNYLDKLKISFYNYYKAQSVQSKSAKA